MFSCSSEDTSSQGSQLQVVTNSEKVFSIDDFYKTSSFVEAIENRQGLKVACLEEIAFNNKWIGKKEINNAINFYGKCQYSNYLKKL